MNSFMQLAREAGYEPGRGFENTPEMRMVRPGVREVALRFVQGTRTFGAFADDGLCVALHIMAPGGDEDAVLDALEGKLIAHRMRGRMLQLVG